MERRDMTEAQSPRRIIKRSGLVSQPAQTPTRESMPAADQAYMRMPELPGGVASRPGQSVAEAGADVSQNAYGLQRAPSGALLIPVHLIDKSPFQNRLQPNDAHVDNLVESITNGGGLIEPIVVRPKAGGRFELIAGENRLLATQKAGYEVIESIVRSCDDGMAAKQVLADNLHHKALCDYEVYLGIKSVEGMIGELGSVRMLSREFGWSRGQVQRYLSFGKLPEGAQEILRRCPTLLGGTMAEKLAARVEAGAGDLVVEALKLVEIGHFQQARADAWVEQQLTSRGGARKAAARERTFSDRSGRDFCRVTRNGQMIKLKLLTDALDHDRLEAAIHAAIEHELSNLPEPSGE
jgi:ParB family chromosome partitioning protein